MANFNRIASLYDFLKRLVFGIQLDRATNHSLNQIPSNSRILIIGGGTGKILQNFNSTHQIKYLEFSTTMLKKAEQLNTKAKVDFIQADILDWRTDEKFDFIITPFVLDCFSEDQLNLMFFKLKNILYSEGKWIQIDFYPKNFIHQLLIKIMYVFFNLMVDLKIKNLADFDLLFEKHHFILERKALFYHSMIESKIYHQID